MYELLLNGMDICLTLFWGYCLCFFYGSLLHGRYRGRKELKRMLSFLLCFFWLCWKLLLDRLVETDFDTSRMLLKTVLLYGGLFLFTVLFFEGRGGSLIYVFVSFGAVSELGRFLAYSFSLPAIRLLTINDYLLESGKITDFDSFLALLEMESVLLQLLMNVLFCVCLYFPLRYIVKMYEDKEYPLHRTELLFLLLPGCTAFLFCALLRIIMVTMEGRQPRFLYDRYPLLIGVIPALLLLCLCSLLYSVKLFRHMIVLHEERNRLMVLEKQVDGMEEHMRETERVYAGIRAMKHDMKNQLAVVTELIKQPGEERELQAYLEQLNQTLGALDFPFRTGSAVVDALVGMKYHELKERVSAAVFDGIGLLIPACIKIRPMDLSVILGNALDNAIEACERLRGERPEAEVFIRISSVQKGNFFVMEVENSFDGCIVWAPGEEFPETLKADKSIHGIGMRNIKTTVLKYHGGVDWSAAGNVFSLSVMLKNENP